MNTELRLHGQINQWVEYYATAIGNPLPHHHFYSVTESEVRFFCPGNELILTSERVIQRGTGGTLCGYTYGDERPPADLVREGVVNRLTLLGATIDDQGQLLWSDQQQAFLDYDQIFNQGHPIHNYFFFVHGLTGDSFQARQETLLRLLGKKMKRLPETAQADDSRLAAKILSLLPNNCTLYLVRLTHTRNHHYQRELRNLYYPHRRMVDSHLKALDELAAQLDIAPRQQERIRLDVIYRHRDNYRVADSYRSILLTCAAQRQMTSAQQQQIARIKTMALRQQVPEVLLLTLEHSYLATFDFSTPEPEYINTTRHLLQQLTNEHQLDKEQIAELLLARQQARNHQDVLFAKIFDECKHRLSTLQHNDNVQSQLHHIRLLLDNLDTTTTAIDRIVFLDNHLPAETVIHQLLSRYHEFNRLDPGLFERLFFNKLNKSCYIGSFGRRKLSHLKQGLSAVAAGHLRTSQMYEELQFITNAEQQYRSALTSARNWLQSNNLSIFNKTGQSALYEALNQEQRTSNVFNLELNRQLFEKILHDLHMEYLYINDFLPEIIHQGNRALREDFFSNSGLDYFHIEELELDYVRDNNLDPETLQRLQCSF